MTLSIIKNPEEEAMMECRVMKEGRCQYRNNLHTHIQTHLVYPIINNR